MEQEQDEEKLLRSVALQNARSIQLARDRAERELLQTQEALRESKEQTTAINEALLIAGLHQHELTEAAEKLNSQLQAEITERKQAEESLRQAQKQLKEHAATLERTVRERTADLKETNEQLAAFVYSIAHDLRAPLRSMQGFSQVLMDDYAPSLDETARNFLNRINASSEFMDKMIIDLLAFGHVGRTDTKLESVKVQAAWETAIYQHATQIEQTKTQIQTVSPLPSVRANEATLAQVLANLLGNAIKFVPDGVQPKIRFWAEEWEEGGMEKKGIGGLLDEWMDGGKSNPPIHPSNNPPIQQSPHPAIPSSRPPPGFVRLWMQDNGEGIPPDQHERIFRVFERLHGSRFPGTGIGLSIVRKGVERMDGSVGLESEPGKGTRFWIELKKA